MLSFLASFILHLLCNAIKFPGRCRNPNPKHWHAWEGAMTECYSQDYSKYIGFWMLRKCRSTADKFRVKLRSQLCCHCQKGKLPLPPQASSELCPLLPRVKLLAKCDSVGGSSPLRLVGWVSFPIFPSWKSPGLGGTRDRNASWGAHSCEQMAELRFLPFLAAVTGGISSLSCMWLHPKQQIHLWQCSVVMPLF